MKRSQYFIPTLKEKPSDIEQISQVYMFRSGMLKKVSNGFFVYMPLMQRMIDKVSGVIKKHMHSVNSQFCKFPILVSQEMLEASGRWNAFGKEMFKLSDRSDNGFAISPTNEETACFVAQTYVKSYKDLPFSVYQIQSKHRDEISPRNGVMRAREFTMKDAYSFHAQEDCLDDYYQKMHKAYLNLFTDMGLKVVSVKADTGAMGGSGSEEIMAVSKDGDTDICKCNSCDYAANIEAVPSNDKVVTKKFAKNKTANYKKVATPNVKTISELVKFFNASESSFCKAVMFMADNKLVCALVKGDMEVNDAKLRKVLGCTELDIASPEQVAKSKKTVVGYVGAVGLKDIKVIADFSVAGMKDFICGANEKGFHLSNVNNGDFTVETYADIRNINEGEKCPICNKGKLSFEKATELGHIFKLGKRYTDKLGMKFVNKEGGFDALTMGCYGIGVERTIAAIVDQHHDDRGIIWPTQIAPFVVHLVTVDMTNPDQLKVSKKLYEDFTKKGIEVLWDDTDARPGSKFADSELIGFPFRVVVGRGVADKKVEFVDRVQGEKEELAIENVVKTVADKLS